MNLNCELDNYSTQLKRPYNLNEEEIIRIRKNAQEIINHISSNSENAEGTEEETRTLLIQWHSLNFALQQFYFINAGLCWKCHNPVFKGGYRTCKKCGARCHNKCTWQGDRCYCNQQNGKLTVTQIFSNAISKEDQ